MKINQFIVIPANVTYDKYLSDKSKLLWGVISAATNVYGICEEDNNYFASALNVDARTILRCFTQLIDNGHIVRIVDKGKRKIKVVFKSLSLDAEEAPTIPEPIDQENFLKFCNNVFSFWETKLNRVVDDKEAYIPIIKKRLKVFSEEEIKTAIENRIKFIHSSQWHMDNLDMASQLSIVLEDDDAVLKWLQINNNTKVYQND